MGWFDRIGAQTAIVGVKRDEAGVWAGVRAWMAWYHGLKEFELYPVGNGEPVQSFRQDYNVSLLHWCVSNGLDRWS